MFNPFKKNKRYETDEEISNRVLALCKKEKGRDYPAPLSAEDALNELCRYFLGNDWLAVTPMSTRQKNLGIVTAIEMKYRRKIDK